MGHNISIERRIVLPLVDCIAVVFSHCIVSGVEAIQHLYRIFNANVRG